MKKSFFGNNLILLRELKGLKQTQMLENIGVNRTTWNGYEKNKSYPKVEDLVKIAEYFDISIDDLLHSDLSNVHPFEKKEAYKKQKSVHLNVPLSVHPTTEKGVDYAEIAPLPESVVQDGENKPVLMPRVVTIDTTGEENAVFVPVRARAGYLLGYGDEKFLEKLPAYKIIGDRNRTYRIFEVDGNSMFPTLSDKDYVNAYWVRITDVRDDRVYVLVTKTEGVIIKRVLNRYKEGVFICKSDNINKKGDYPPIVLNVHDILEVWYVDSRTSRNLTPPGEIYQRISDLEANMAIILHRLNAQ